MEELDQQASVIASMTPLSPQEARAAIVLSQGGGTDELKDALGRESAGGARNARASVKQKTQQSQILSTFDVDEIADHIRSEVPAVPSYGLRGVEAYIGDLTAGKSVLFNAHIDELLDNDTPLAVICLDIDGFSGCDDLHDFHPGRKLSPDEDDVSLPEEGTLDVWDADVPRGDNVMHENLFTSLMSELKSASEHLDYHIVLFVDEGNTFIPEGYRLSGRLPENISVRASYCKADGSFRMACNYRGDTRYHVFRSSTMGEDLKRGLNLSDMEWDWVQNATKGSENAPASIFVKEVSRDPDSYSKPQYVRYLAPEKYIT